MTSTVVVLMEIEHVESVYNTTVICLYGLHCMLSADAWRHEFVCVTSLPRPSILPCLLSYWSWLLKLVTWIQPCMYQMILSVKAHKLRWIFHVAVIEDCVDIPTSSLHVWCWVLVGVVRTCLLLALNLIALSSCFAGIAAEIWWCTGSFSAASNKRSQTRSSFRLRFHCQPKLTVDSLGACIYHRFINIVNFVQRLWELCFQV